MQNARISELEKVLAKSSSAPSPRNIKSSDLSSSEEMNTLKEENRVVCGNRMAAEWFSLRTTPNLTFSFRTLLVTAYRSHGCTTSTGGRI